MENQTNNSKPKSSETVVTKGMASLDARTKAASSGFEAKITDRIEQIVTDNQVDKIDEERVRLEQQAEQEEQEQSEALMEQADTLESLTDSIIDQK